MDKDVALVIERKQNEIKELESSIDSIKKKAEGLKPTVTAFNKLMQEKNDLSRTLHARKKDLSIVAKVFEGTSIFDQRFPLFAGEERHES